MGKGSSITAIVEPVESRLYLSGTLFQDHVSYALPDSTRSIAVADFNGDGNKDIVAAVKGQASLSVLLGNGDGTFQAAQSFNCGSEPWGVAVADLNGDGFEDLVVTNYAPGTISVLLNRGGMHFDSPTTFAAGAGPGHLRLADVTCDGKLDAVVLNMTSGDVNVLAGNGDGTFGARKTTATDLTPWSMSLADFNDDGKLDIVTGTRWGNGIALLIGNGDGTFGKSSHPAGAPYMALGAADLNGNGKEELVIGIFNAQNPSVTVLADFGFGGAVSAKAYAIEDIALSLVVGDFNKDGKLDIVNGSADGGSILLGNGNGTFQPEQKYSPGLGADNILAADLNNDGVLDLVAAGQDKSVAVLMNEALLPQIGSLTPSKTNIARPESLTVTANGVSAAGSTVGIVEFFRDVNGNGLLDLNIDQKLGDDITASDGWSCTFATADFSVGANTILAVATDVRGIASRAAATQVVADNSAPTGTVTADPIATKGYPVTLCFANAADGDGQIVNVEFWRDSNGDGAITAADELLGSDADSSDGWGFYAQTDSLELGPQKYFARAHDNDNAASGWSSVQVELLAPWDWDASATLDVVPGEITRPNRLTFTGNLPSPDGLALGTVEVYFDASGNGLLNIPADAWWGDMDLTTAGTYTLDATSAGLPAGTDTFLLRARNSQGAWSSPISPVSAQTVVTNLPPTLASLTSDINPASRADTFRLIADATDDLAIAGVSFYRDNGDGVLGGGDTLLGEDTSAQDGWSLSLSGGGYTLGSHGFLAVAHDGEGGVSEVRGTTVQIVNAGPVIGSLTSSPTMILRGQSISLTASNVSDPDAHLSTAPGAGQVTVKFYLDANNDGIAQDSELIFSDSSGTDGYGVTVANTANLPLGRNVFLARGFDNEGTGGKAVEVGVHVVHPVGTWTNQTGAIVTVYDLGGEMDIVAGDIVVKFGKNNSVTSITFRGASAMTGLAIGVAGASSVGKIVDGRKTPGDIAFIASSCPVGSVSVKGNVGGYVLDGLAMPGLNLSGDMDGDGKLNDRTAFYFAGTNMAAPGKPGNKSISVRGSLAGNVVLAGGLGKMTVKGAIAQSDIVVGGTRSDMSLTVGSVTECTVRTDGTIKSISTGGWTDADDRADLITADYIGSLTIKGNMQADIATVSGGYRSGLGKASVTGNLDNVTIDVHGGDIKSLTVGGVASHSTVRTDKNIGAITLGASDCSDFLAGVMDSVDRRATTRGCFASDNLIKSFTVRGIKGTPVTNRFFSDSNVSAARIGSVKLVNVQSDNQGQRFGFFASQSANPKVKPLAKVSGNDKANGQKFAWPGRTPGVGLNLGDLMVRVL